MTTEREKRDMPALVADILTSEHLSHPIIQQLGRLLIADSEFNVWVRDVAKRLGLTDDEWLTLFEETEAIHEACEEAWRIFRAAEWPRFQYEAWKQNDDAFLAVLEECTARTIAARDGDRWRRRS